MNTRQDTPVHRPPTDGQRLAGSCRVERQQSARRALLPAPCGRPPQPTLQHVTVDWAQAQVLGRCLVRDATRSFFNITNTVRTEHKV